MTIYCSGIGGIGLSAYAAVMKKAGHDVYGSDRSDSALMEDLRLQGIHIHLKQDGSGMPENIDLFVYSEAIPEDAPERAEMRKRGVRQISYFHAVGELTKGKDLVAICGTHGKSSTTAMLASVCIDAGLDPTVIVGTKVPALDGKNWRVGATNFWIVEACEYRRSFRYLSPKTILLTNADGDHFDAFTDAEDYQNAFVEFVGKLSSSDPLILHGADRKSVDIARGAKKNFIDADNESLPELTIPGLHMQQNAQLVVAFAQLHGLDAGSVKNSLKNFKGTWRRMELRGTTADGITIIDDYAHHPTEIKATLQAMKSAYKGRRIVSVFQPHTHDRTLKLWEEFTQSFQDSDVVVLTKIYDARPDKDSALADERTLAACIEKGSQKPTFFGGSVAETETMLRSNFLHRGDVLVIMGAGDITSLANIMIKDRV